MYIKVHLYICTITETKVCAVHTCICEHAVNIVKVCIWPYAIKDHESFLNSHVLVKREQELHESC